MSAPHTTGHSPTPWSRDDHLIFGQENIHIADCLSAQPYSSARPYSTDTANASLIVRAVNSHSALVKALRKAALSMHCQCIAIALSGHGDCPLCEARAALALAGGGDK